MMVRCIDPAKQVLWKIQSGNDSFHRRTNGRTDGRKRWNWYTLSTTLKGVVWRLSQNGDFFVSLIANNPRVRSGVAHYNKSFLTKTFQITIDDIAYGRPTGNTSCRNYLIDVIEVIVLGINGIKRVLIDRARSANNSVFDGKSLHMLCHDSCRHDMETFSASLSLCEGNPPVTGGFP